MKKLLVIITALVMAAAVSANLFAAGDSLTLSVSVDNDTPNRDEEITLTVSLDSNPGLIYLGFDFEFDTAALEFVSLENGNTFDSSGLHFDYQQSSDKSNPRGMFEFASSSQNLTNTGTLLTIRFKVLDTAAFNDTDIKFNVNESYNYDLQSLTVDTIDAVTLTVSCDHAAAALTPAKDADCTNEGNTAYWYCATCGKFFSDSNNAAGSEIEENSWVTPALGHDLINHPEVPATCQSEGTIEYWSCSRCSKNFSDSEGKTEVDDLTIPVADHTHDRYEYNDTEHWSVCKDCGDEIQGTKAAHDNNAVAPGKEPTCTEPGLTEEKSCSVCGKVVEPATTISAAGHSMKNIDTKAATCTEDGNKEYYECQVCSELYWDDQGSNPITDSTYIIGKLGHNMTEYPEIKPTCSVAGNSAYWHCSRCDKYFSDAMGNTEIAKDSWVISATGEHVDADGEWETDADYHWYTCGCGTEFDKASHSGGEANCKNPAVCETCGKSYGSVDPDNHAGNTYLVGEKEATCTEKGYTGDTYCSDCNTKLQDGTEIAMLAHTESDWMTDDSEHWKECTVCHNDIDGTRGAHNKDLTVPGQAPTCTEPGFSEAKKCSVCDKIVEASNQVPATGHSMTFTDAKAATCTEYGNSAYYYCSNCSKYFSDGAGNNEIAANSWVINKLPHNYQNGYCTVCGAAEPKDNYPQAYIYLNDSFHGIVGLAGAMVPQPHIQDAVGTYRDAQYEWHVCSVCGYVFGKTEIANEEVIITEPEEIVIEEPVQSGDSDEDSSADSAQDVTVSEPNPVTSVTVGAGSLLAAIAGLTLMALRKRSK